MQIRKVSSLIRIDDFLWLDALLLKAEIFTVDTRLSDLLNINFSVPVHEYIFCYEIVNLCLCF